VPKESCVIRRVVVASVTAGVFGVLSFAPAVAGAKSSDSGETAKAPSEIVADAGQAMAQLSSVRLAGSITTGAKQISLNIVSSHGAGGGTMGLNGAKFTIVVTPPDVYMRADAASWTKLAHSQVAGQLFAGKWLHTTTADKDFGGFSNLFDLSTFTTSSSDGPITKGAVQSYHGTKALPLENTSKGSVVYIAATGKPYVLGIAGTGKNRGEVVFSQFGTAKVPAAPTTSIDLSQLEQKAGSGTGSNS
jgi:hypothetical protein